jgi:hypothetical protein
MNQAAHSHNFYLLLQTKIKIRNELAQRSQLNRDQMNNIDLSKIVRGPIYKMLSDALNETAIRFSVPRVAKKKALLYYANTFVCYSHAAY